MEGDKSSILPAPSVVEDKTTIIVEEKTSIIPNTIIDRKPIVKKKSRFPLFRTMVKRNSSNEKIKQTKNSDKSRDDKNNSINEDSPRYSVDGDSAPNSPARFSTPPRGTLRKYASTNNLQDLTDNMGMSPSVSNENLQEGEGSMNSNGSSPYNLSDLSTMRHKHSVSTGNIPELTTKGGMSYSKSTSNLQDLKKSGMRRYASALNLLDLDINEEVDAEEEGDDQLENCAGDAGIDDKADQFIAQFYQQMKSQHTPKRRQYY